jgi:hypothetical protein
VLSAVPMCLSSVYKEKALGDVDLDSIYLNGWVALFQFLIGLPLTFPSALAVEVQGAPLPMSGVLNNMWEGMLVCVHVCVCTIRLGCTKFLLILDVYMCL